MNDSIGALWMKRGGKGQYMTGEVTVNGVKVKIVCFLNTHKASDKHPDWRILESRPQSAYMAPRVEEETRNQAALNEPHIDTIEYPEEVINPDDIPF